MSSDTISQIQDLRAGGVWKDQDTPGDDSWTGEPATVPKPQEPAQSVFVPQTPSQEDTEIIQTYVKNPQFVAAISRAIERELLKNSGRESKTSLIQQMTQERDAALDKVREWMAKSQLTRSLEDKENNQAMTKVQALEEKLISLEQKVSELMSTVVDQKTQERTMIEEAYKVLKERRNEEMTSEQTPSEVSRLECRADELASQLRRLEHDKGKTVVAPRPAVRNMRKFGALF